MSGNGDDRDSETPPHHNGSSATGPAIPADDPRVTPLGGNAGVHIRSEEEEEEELPLDFGGFIVSLGTSCMVNLGKHENPETGRLETDLEAAQQVIHILQMLQHKTRGNLSVEEEKLLATLLFDLREAYDEAAG